MKRKIVFVTGTRADFGKLKPLIQVCLDSRQYQVHVFATGMHLLEKFGSTVNEIFKCNFPHIHMYNNSNERETALDIVLANTIRGLSDYVKTIKPDLLVVHGDRSEALAGAIVGSCNRIRVGHVEGGELSGTIDGMLRHSITKLALIHFVANESARSRLLQLGEDPKSIFKIGSPEIDIMRSALPSLKKVCQHYAVPFQSYGILLYHPVHHEQAQLKKKIRSVVNAVLNSGQNFIVIYPNNDPGSQFIIDAYQRLENKENVRCFPSLRFEAYLTFLKHARFILGNSSSGVREAPYFGRPSIDLGSRQANRASGRSIFHCDEEGPLLKQLLQKFSKEFVKFPSLSAFGEGNSEHLFFEALRSELFWKLPLQKEFSQKPLPIKKSKRRITNPKYRPAKQIDWI